MFERFWGCKMSVEGGSDRQQAGFLIIAAVGFPHGNVRFCQTFISFIDFHVFYLICELLLLLKTFCRKKKYFAKVMKSCRHFEAKKCKETYQFSVNCATCKREILSAYLRIVSLQILQHQCNYTKDSQAQFGRCLATLFRARISYTVSYTVSCLQYSI